MAKKDRHKQNELDESAELAQALVRCAGTGIYIVQDGKFQYANDLFQELTGYSEPELIGKYSLDLVHSEDRETVRKKAIASLKVGSPLPYEYRFVKKNGEVSWVLEKVTSTEYKGKRATVGSFLDVTELKLAEEALLESQARYRSIVETGGAGVLVGDLSANITFVNESFCKILGYCQEELVGKSFADFLHPDDKAIVLEKFAEGLARPEAGYKLEFRAIHKDGRVVWIYPSVSPIFYKNALTSGMAIVFDITERKQLEEAVKKSEERYRTMLDEIQDSYFEVDLAGNFTFVNDAMCRTMGYSEEELIGINYKVFAAKEDVDVVYRDFNRVYKTGETIKGLSYKFIQKNGTVGFGELSISAIKNEEGEVIAFRGIARDVTERKHLEQELADIATHDFLTGLPNRVLLHDRLNVELAHAKRNETNLAVMMLDLDRFKVVNDTFGHSIGDKLLRAAGERLVVLVRESDTVSRVGGDEFLVLLPKIAKVGNATRIAQKILGAFRKPFVIDGYQIRVTTSIGIAIYPEDGEDADDLMANADTAMYWVKGQGRNDYSLHSVDKAKIS
jgi:diguanylate cyclase (GGDEF)-like protein/PAS domain S-box-containing protein